MEIPESLQPYWQDGFDLKSHLREFLNLTPQELTAQLATGCEDLAKLGRRDFDWQNASAFYGQHEAGRLYLFDLAAWHLTSQQHIGDSLLLIADRAKGVVLDFGGGIGTHTISAALSPNVTKVFYCDLNPLLQKFVALRVNKLGLEHKVVFCTELPQTPIDTICCFDVLEHLPNPSQQVLNFYHGLAPEGIFIANWYFSRGFEEEYPFHLDYLEQSNLVTQFFETLQTHFLEEFHPYFTTTRCYRKVANKIK